MSASKKRPVRRGGKPPPDRPQRALFCLALKNPIRKLCIDVVEWKYPFCRLVSLEFNFNESMYVVLLFCSVQWPYRPMQNKPPIVRVSFTYKHVVRILGEAIGAHTSIGKRQRKANLHQQNILWYSYHCAAIFLQWKKLLIFSIKTKNTCRYFYSNHITLCYIQKVYSASANRLGLWSIPCHTTPFETRA